MSVHLPQLFIFTTPLTLRIAVVFIVAMLVNPCMGITQITEICDNAIDDDGNGLIDFNDPNCECLTVEVISRIPNPSFEETNCCPGTRSQLYCANGWIQASEPTTDLIHDCGDWDGWPDFPPPRPYPDGNGIMGFRDGRRIGTNDQENEWKEYAGACLTAPLLAGETYKFEFYVGFVNSTVSPRLDITFFGTPSCDFLPFGKNDAAFGCPTNGPNWKRLAAVEVRGSSGWIKASLEATPDEDIYAIAIGPPCNATSATVSTYYFFDDLILDDIEDFQLIISEESHPCSSNYILSVPDRDGYDYQWYKEGIALIGETESAIENVTEGDYQVRLLRDNDCRITSVYNHRIPVIENDISEKICDGSSFQFGDRLISESGLYTDTFISVDGCDSIVNLSIIGLSTIRDTVYASIFFGGKYSFGDLSFRTEGEHIAPLVDAEGCDYFVHIFLDHFQVYAPNIFSPNGDGNNDYFFIEGGPELINIKEMSIYDRWGGKVFQALDIIPGDGSGWDGRNGNNTVASGIYTYAITVLMENGLEKTLYGSVLLIR